MTGLRTASHLPSPKAVPFRLCAAHGRHTPSPAYAELHHVVPQAWQRFWSPETDPNPQYPNPELHPGMGDQGMLWDARTVELCRTGHGNVHTWLVMLGHILDSKAAEDLDAAVKVLKVDAKRRSLKVARAELEIARAAIERYVAAGGPLLKLYASGQFGAI